MSEPQIIATVIAAIILTANTAVIIWWIFTTPKHKPQICALCDVEGPHEPENIPYAGLDTHRELHRAGRELMKPFERIINWIESKLTRA